jgi:hypothetical protein
VDIMAQRLSGDGKLLWNEGKEPSVVSSSKGLERNPTVVPDGKGGLIVAFEFEPREGGNKGDVDIMAQRLDGDGKMLWNKGERSVMVSSGTAVEQGVRGVPLADGGAIFVFDVLFREGENAGDLDILTQRLDADGKLVWNEGERSAVVSSSKWRESGPIPLPDGEGGLIVILPAGGPPGEHEGDIDIEAMRLSGEGKLVWNNGERAVDVAAGKALERNPCAVSITAE